MCCSLAGESLVAVAPLDMTPLERPVAGCRAALGEGGMLWRPDDMAPDEEGRCPLTATDVL